MSDIRFPQRNLSPDANNWARTVEAAIQELSQKQTETSQSASRALSGVNNLFSLNTGTYYSNINNIWNTLDEIGSVLDETAAGGAITSEVAATPAYWNTYRPTEVYDEDGDLTEFIPDNPEAPWYVVDTHGKVLEIWNYVQTEPDEDGYVNSGWVQQALSWETLDGDISYEIKTSSQLVKNHEVRLEQTEDLIQDTKDLLDETDIVVSGLNAEVVRIKVDVTAALLGLEQTNQKLDQTVKDSVVEYALSESRITAPVDGWTTNTVVPGPNQVVWVRTKVTHGNDTVVYSSPAILTGPAGESGPGISSTEVSYALSSSPTTPPTNGWTSGVPTLVKGRYLWTRTLWTYTNDVTEAGFSVTYIPLDGAEGGGIETTDVSYAVSSSGTMPPTTGWQADVPVAAAGQFIWTRTTWTYSGGGSDISYSVGKIGDTGPKGDDGNDAKTISLTANTQVLVTPAAGGATSPATAVVSGVPTNTTIAVWQYSTNGGDFSNTLPTGVTRSGNKVTITGATMTASTITVRMADSAGNADTFTVAKVKEGVQGQDGYTVLLSNEAHTFAAGPTSAIASNVEVRVIAYRGAARQIPTIGAISGHVEGLTTTVQFNGTNDAQFTVEVDENLTEQSGMLEVPVTVNNSTFALQFSWTLALTGKPSYTHIAYADTAQGGGFSLIPGEKKYMGVLTNNNPVASTVPGDYTWSLTQGISVTAIVPHFWLGATEPAQPTTATPSGWVTTEPNYQEGLLLWRSDKVSYSNGSFSWTPVTQVSSYQAAITSISVANLAREMAENLISFEEEPPETPPVGQIWLPMNEEQQITGMWRWSGDEWQVYSNLVGMLIVPTEDGGQTIVGPDGVDTTQLLAEIVRTDVLYADVAGVRTLVITDIPRENLASSAQEALDTADELGSRIVIDGAKGTLTIARNRPSPKNPLTAAILSATSLDFVVADKSVAYIDSDLEQMTISNVLVSDSLQIGSYLGRAVGTTGITNFQKV